MLKFIISISDSGSWWTEISIHLMLKFIPGIPTDAVLLPLFQYISCWSLSEASGYETLVYAKFQYISCWSLSMIFITQETMISNFNTSHVEVYLPASFFVRRNFSHFNTSHVEVYRRKFSCTIFAIIISIHLMLKFIRYRNTSIHTQKWFQYISCWSLSVVLFLINQF